ncbi:hypothetical protein [Streptomyces sp. cg36]|uniref:hypothetical protein n=1 Tax=Streptomyces sp. cg36 TaxID=3238798 RepID=UPI0034E2AF6F
MRTADRDPVVNMLRVVQSYEPDGGPAAAGPSSRSGYLALSSQEEREARAERARELAGMPRLTRQRSSRAVVDWLKNTVVSDPVSFDLERVMQAATAYQARHGDLKAPAAWEQDGLLLGVDLDKPPNPRRPRRPPPAPRPHRRRTGGTGSLAASRTRVHPARSTARRYRGRVHGSR